MDFYYYMTKKFCRDSAYIKMFYSTLYRFDVSEHSDAGENVGV